MQYIQTNNHIPFILRPATEIVKEAIWSLNATNGGIETYPISSYLLHSLFLKLTGAQEQKLKCICWEIACRDYEYRYDRFERNRYSECSGYDDKNMVYNDILNAIKKHDNSFLITDDIKNNILHVWKTSTRELFGNGVLYHNFKRKYDEYKELITDVDKKWIMNNKQLLTNEDNISPEARRKTFNLALQGLFKKHVFVERNRCAHNTRSYQHNLPSIKEMVSPEHKLQNYFLFMSIIILLDEIYRKLFETYLGTQ
jgi:hypothetical protein